MVSAVKDFKRETAYRLLSPICLPYFCLVADCPWNVKHFQLYCLNNNMHIIPLKICKRFIMLEIVLLIVLNAIPH